MIFDWLLRVNIKSHIRAIIYFYLLMPVFITIGTIAVIYEVISKLLKTIFTFPIEFVKELQTIKYWLDKDDSYRNCKSLLH